MKTSYSCDPDITASYYPFFLLKKGKTGTNFLVANIIRVAPERRYAGRLAVCIMALLAQTHTFRGNKRMRVKGC
jgi:hypothetical protein